MKTHATLAAFALVALYAGRLLAYGGEVLAEIPSPVGEPMGLAVEGKALWVSSLTTRMITKVDPNSAPNPGAVIESIPALGATPTGLAWHGGVLYSADRWEEVIARRRVHAEADLSPLRYYERWAMGMAHDGEHLWVVDARAAKVHKLDPVDGTTIASFPAPGRGPTGIAFDGHHLWVADHKEDAIYLVDRHDGLVVTSIASPGPYPSALAADGEALWVADYEQGQLYRVALPDEVPYVEDEPRKVRASLELRYTAKGVGDVTGLTVYVAVPQDIPGQHLLSDLSFSPTPSRTLKDKWGQVVAVFELGTLKGGEVGSVRWEGDFALFRTRFHLLPERVQAAKIPSGLDRYLADEQKYDLEAPVVGELATRLTRDEPSYYWRARAIYEHLTDIITYERSGGWNNAAAVLERGTGSCSEYTFALIALLRRAGIPARYVGAVSRRGDDSSYDDVFHRWAEVYMPGYGWVPADANAGHGAPPGERGFFFGGRTNRHVVTTVGGGGSEYLGWDYNAREEYGTRGTVTLEVKTVGRQVALPDGPEVQPHEAAEVIIPRLTHALKRGRSVGAGGASPWRSPYLAGIALAVATGLGFLLGRLRR